MSMTFIPDEEGGGGGEKDKSAFIDHRLSLMVKIIFCLCMYVRSLLNNYLFEVCKMNFIRRGLQCKNRGREPEVFM